jgi:hypothetical protein
MRRDHLLDGPDWLLPRRRRRLRIGDLMVAIALACLGLGAVTRPDLSGGDRLLLGLVALAVLVLQLVQWGLASVRVHRLWSGADILLGILSSLLALFVFVGLILLGLVLPQGAALISVMMLIMVVYLTTWD